MSSTFGLETNAGVEVGHTWSSYPDAAKSDILGKSVSGETQWNWAVGGTIGSDRTDSGKNSTEISVSVEFSALPTTGSLDFNTTRESTYDYKSAVTTLHSSEELDGWIVGE